MPAKIARSQWEGPRPAELISIRCEAFNHADFGSIFDSYHSRSNFRLQFPDRQAYIRYGWSHLAKEYRILRCQVVKEEIYYDEARVIAIMEVAAKGVLLKYAELAYFRKEASVWRYHFTQRMEEDHWPQKPMSLDFADFERLEPKIIF